MIQKFICVPKSDYDVLIISNGTISQIESTLSTINHISDHEIPSNSSITYLDDFLLLISHIDLNYPSKLFSGKVLFMFFNGLEYIQDFLSSLIDHYNRCMYVGRDPNYYNQYKAQHKYLQNNPVFERFENAYFYFDSSITNNNQHDLLDEFMMLQPFTFDAATQTPDINFNTIMTIANDVLKKMSFMLGRIRGLYIDDINLSGGRNVPLHCLLRNFPNLERVQLSSAM